MSLVIEEVQMKKENVYKIDLRVAEEFSDPNKTYANSTEIIRVYNIPIVVPKVEQELKDKLSVSRIAEKDNLDIVNLLGILYLKRIPPEEIVNYLGWGERKRLYNLIKGFEEESL
ncbi:hypothetical protein DRJ19_02425 [Candidatus Woesearchaeota archaeon]|nr:MAG: hypothetical protein DRJ19_02425 [Candidatus Woesearchaeota archaeon]